MAEPVDLAKLVGSAVRQHRTRRGLTQDDLASMMRAYRWSWERPTVSKVEAGTRDLDLREAISVCLVLGIGLPVLLDSSEAIELRDGVVIGDSQLRQVVTSDAAIGGPTAGPKFPALNLGVNRAMRELEAMFDDGPLDDVLDTVPPEEVIEQAQAAQHKSPERSTARQLGLTPLQVAIASIELWGRSVSDELDARLDARSSDDQTPDTRRTVRGHVTRELRAELRDFLAHQSHPKAHQPESGE